MASGISAANIDSMIRGRGTAKEHEFAQLSGYLGKNEFSAKLARARAGVEALSESELKTAALSLCDAAQAELLALPDPNFDNAVKFISDAIKTAEQVLASA